MASHSTEKQTWCPHSLWAPGHRAKRTNLFMIWTILVPETEPYDSNTNPSVSLKVCRSLHTLLLLPCRLTDASCTCLKNLPKPCISQIFRFFSYLIFCLPAALIMLLLKRVLSSETGFPASFNGNLANLASTVYRQLWF